MKQEAITRYIKDTFDGLDVTEASGDVFFYVDPDGTSDPTHRLPFATVVTSDAYDEFSDLNRPSIYRLNIGLSQETFRVLFPSGPREEDGQADRRDYTALNQIMPHPIYGNMFWVCVLNPTDSTFTEIRPLLDEAYAVAVGRHQRSRRHPPSADTEE